MATPRHVKLFGMSAKRPLGSSATRASGLKVLPSYFEQEGKQRQDKHCRAHIVGCFLAVIFSKWAARAYLKISKQKQIAADPHLGHVRGRAICICITLGLNQTIIPSLAAPTFVSDVALDDRGKNAT